MAGIQVLLITADSVEPRAMSEVESLLTRNDALTWVDIPECSDEAVILLTEVLGCHPLAVRDCLQRNRVPRIRIYPHQQLLILHGPERGPSGHVHYIELDQIMAIDTSSPCTARSIRRSTRRSPCARPRRSGAGCSPANYDPIPRTRFRTPWCRRWRTRWKRSSRSSPTDDLPLVADLVDQLNRIRGLADGEREYLQGVIEYYRTQADTKMTIAAERLAVIAVVTLPITALSSIYGMNIIVNDHTQVTQLVVILAIMTVMSALLLTWAKRRGWW